MDVSRVPEFGNLLHIAGAEYRLFNSLAWLRAHRRLEFGRRRGPNLGPSSKRSFYDLQNPGILILILRIYVLGGMGQLGFSSITIPSPMELVRVCPGSVERQGPEPRRPVTAGGTGEAARLGGSKRPRKPAVGPVSLRLISELTSLVWVVGRGSADFCRQAIAWPINRSFWDMQQQLPCKKTHPGSPFDHFQNGLIYMIKHVKSYICHVYSKIMVVRLFRIIYWRVRLPSASLGLSLSGS